MKNILIVAKAVLFNGTDVLIVRRSDTDSRRPLEWDLPGGMVEEDEPFNEACAREIQEEVGIEIKPTNLHLAHAHTEWVEGKGSTTWMIYLARTTQKEVKLSYEHDQHKWLPLTEAISLFTYERHLKALRHIKNNNLIP